MFGFSIHRGHTGGRNPVNAMEDSASDVGATKGTERCEVSHSWSTNGDEWVYGRTCQTENWKSVVQRNVHIAPVEQEILLGFDIKSVLDMTKRIIIFDDQAISLDIGSQG